MREKLVEDLESKILDYKRFAFILLSLSIFLFIGLIVPTTAIKIELQGFVVAGVFIMLGLAFICHRMAMKIQQQMHSDENES
ncbi:YrhC family protein [Halalkalibacter urbisdiaboli]|uniref:YrhC family protein n=1 Tax=Halalkalibacter urbisdiaboli TaxID=1960589 RepID=UPI000B438794|nr:YrhC family protein [Halalkalibacter urbisdiaboli]